MQDRPDKKALLEAVARFLAEDVRPLVSDAGIAYRTLVSAHLLQIVVRELELDAAQSQAQEERRAALQFSDEASAAAAIRAHELAADPGSEVWNHVVRTLREKLAVVNPKFDLSKEIE